MFRPRRDAVLLNSQPISLAGGELRERRHVCALFNGPDEAHQVLVPYAFAAIGRGERVVYVIDPATRGEHLGRLRSSGIDVPALTASGQIEMLPWTSVYLHEGGFDRAVAIGNIRRMMRKSRAPGFPVSHLISYADWAQTDLPGVDDFLTYEARVDEVLRHLPDVAICAYDLRRNDAARVAELISIHPVAIVNQKLQHREGPGHRAAARDRILEAAAQLFHENGVRATGVDTLIAAAGVAKATFYRHFPSKEDLVVAWLKGPSSRWFDRVRAQAEADARSPEESIPLAFEATAEWLAAEGFRGCPYLNTATEIVDADNPARGVIREYLEEIEVWLRDQVAAAGFADSDILGKELQALLAGSISLGVARRTTAFVVAAREAASALLSTARRA